jgi:glycosyltransferase involved in cell wall biosynthesis
MQLRTSTPIPLAALLLRPFVFLLPAKFQYLGPWAALSIALQFYFGVRLLRLFFGPRLWPLLCGGLLLTISPPLAYRLAGHFALANHWLILAAFYLYFAWQRGAIKSGRRLAIAWCTLTVIAVAIASCLPIVATAVDRVPNIVQTTGGGWLCPRDDAHALVAVMEAAITSPGCLAQAERSRRSVAEIVFGGAHGSDYERVYQQLLQ